MGHRQRVPPACLRLLRRRCRLQGPFALSSVRFAWVLRWVSVDASPDLRRVSPDLLCFGLDLRFSESNQTPTLMVLLFLVLAGHHRPGDWEVPRVRLRHLLH
uniref:Uncharacterized protein n=1 Tax=Setaria italica TaxID=4555 RepID=K4ANS7_SETIT